MTRILAIDPGPTKSAYVVWDGERVLQSGIVGNDDMLTVITRDEFETDQLVIEQIEAMGMAVGREVFETVFWSGRFCEAWRCCQWGRWHRVTRRQVKLHLCGSMRAKDANIRQALIDKVGAPGTKKAPGPTYGISKDKWSALAVAVTWWEMQRLRHEVEQQH